MTSNEKIILGVIFGMVISYRFSPIMMFFSKALTGFIIFFLVILLVLFIISPLFKLVDVFMDYMYNRIVKENEETMQNKIDADERKKLEEKKQKDNKQALKILFHFVLYVFFLIGYSFVISTINDVFEIKNKYETLYNILAWFGIGIMFYGLIKCFIDCFRD